MTIRPIQSFARLPRPVLLSEHQHDRILILNEAEEIVWQYPVSHPQDVWMLNDGNILTTYMHGVRLITRAKLQRPAST